jgi:hypothetical protein
MEIMNILNISDYYKKFLNIYFLTKYNFNLLMFYNINHRLHNHYNYLINFNIHSNLNLLYMYLKLNYKFNDYKHFQYYYMLNLYNNH